MGALMSSRRPAHMLAVLITVVSSHEAVTTESRKEYQECQCLISASRCPLTDRTLFLLCSLRSCLRLKRVVHSLHVPGRESSVSSVTDYRLDDQVWISARGRDFSLRSRSMSPLHGARPPVADGRDGLQIWRVAANMLSKQSWTADKGWSCS
jgi:hypothetical protein